MSEDNLGYIENIEEVFYDERDFRDFVFALKVIKNRFVHEIDNSITRHYMIQSFKELISKYFSSGKLKFDFEPAVIARSGFNGAINIGFYKKEE